MEKTQDIITSIERFTLVKNICLIRRDCLTAEEVTGTYELQKTKGTGRVLARKKIDEISKPLCLMIVCISVFASSRFVLSSTDCLREE